MKLVVACVPKEYDLERIKKCYPDSAVYVTSKTESEDKVKEQIKRNQYIVFDSDYINDSITSQVEYSKSFPDKIIKDLKGVI